MLYTYKRVSYITKNNNMDNNKSNNRGGFFFGGNVGGCGGNGSEGCIFPLVFGVPHTP